MELTNEIIEELGFKRINNSMWRDRNITLQNGWKCDGDSLMQKILTTKKAYKVCVDGKFKEMITRGYELGFICIAHHTPKETTKDK